MYKDKSFTNPILGQISCSALCLNYSECIDKAKVIGNQH